MESTFFILNVPDLPDKFERQSGFLAALEHIPDVRTCEAVPVYGDLFGRM